MGMTLPAVLLVLDVYPLRRLEWAAWRTSVKRLLVEKIPWFLLALIFAGVALAASQKHGVAPAGHDVFRRLVQAVYGLGFYPGKTVLPLDLSPLYILPPHFDPSAPRFLLAVTVVPLTAAALFLGRRRWPWAVAAAFAYAIIISPVLGLAQVGDQLVADRYSYLSCLPFAVLVAAALARLWLEWQAGTWTRVAWLAAAIGVTVWVGDLARQTYQQCGVWHDSFSLWDHAIRCDPANAVAFYNRGTMWQAQGDFDRAVADYETTLRLDPAYAKAYTNRGTIRQIRKNWTGARADYDMAIRVNAREARAYYNRGLLRKRQRDFEGTLADFDAAIRFKPNFFEAFTNRSVVRLNRGDVAGALADGDMAIRVSPRDPESYAHRAGLRLKQKDAAGAAADYAKALAVAPLNWPRRAAVEQQLQILRAPLPVHTPQPSR
jgi:tetratricopeptide (TPR) repeat protein